jgi:hypothetical protein
MNKQTFTNYIKSFKFKELFNELGWDNISISPIPVKIDEETFTLTAVAEKRGFIIFQCSPDSQGKIPTKDIRKKIDTKISKLYFEHLIIYSDKNNTQQIWQLVIREQDKPLTVRETDYFSTQHPELLFQKLRGLFISIDQEDNITLADVRSAVREQFNTNAERVTKRFYTEFKTQHTAFLKFIKGIEDTVNKEWYASLMLNRLMFIYFIQKKGFLDNNPNYLRNKLKEIQQRKGKDKFFSFYRNFLLVLFHKGLGSPERSEKLLKELGKVPYLNGGLFDVHQIEKEYKNIEIEDKAFEKIFAFFDEYNWHLDNRVTASGRDINPDVIGYIFEKYINDRAAMGAYYTKEDITEYIAKNTIIPFLFDQVKKDCANAFKDESSLWKMLRENPDKYIYDAVKYGVNLTEEEFNSELNLDDPNHPLWKNFPDEIKQGFRPDLKDKIVVADDRPHLWEIRKAWNRPAPSDVALPTEIWREVIERHKRYFEIRRKISNGEIKEINDFITYNLNIRQFAQDAVEQYEGSDFINAFYKAITKITVLDPTCGSGAFLFAALNILEPLYYACIERMKGFIELDDLQGGKKFPQFRKIIEEIKQHPSQQYYIYKSIILNNLYGVDIMKEAVEIAKLRLFLKLVAEVDEFDHLEPLPDIDFNIRSGNTLIGFTSYKEIKNVYEETEVKGKLMFGEEKNILQKIEDQALIVSKLFKEFKRKQTIIEVKQSEIKNTKDEVQQRLNQLNQLLNEYKAYEYGIDSEDLKQQKRYNDWLATHKPFHWFAEFYEIMESGGFDVIIGNPPYVEYSKVRNEYTIRNYETESCGNLYAFVIERSFIIGNSMNNISMIIPMSGTVTPRMSNLQYLFLKKNKLWISYFAGDSNPGQLFEGVKSQLSIFINKYSDYNEIFTTKYKRWFWNEREIIFSNIYYINSTNYLEADHFKKLNFRIELTLLKKIKNMNGKVYQFVNSSGKNILFYKNAGNAYYRMCYTFEPITKENGTLKKSSTLNTIQTTLSPKIFQAIISSNLFNYFWFISSDCYHLTKTDIYEFPIYDLNKSDDYNKLLVKLSTDLEADYKKHSIIKTTFYKTKGQIDYQEFYPRFSKPIIDEIDTVLAEHYGFTEEELDFIINYDIKYRMGKQNDEDE